MKSSDILVGGNKETKLRDLQLKSLETLVYFKEFCIKHDLRFFLYGGSCIGAVRHQGFIPWDDDIDVIMFREDYERLWRIWNKYADTNRYSCCRTDKNVNLKHSMISIRDNNTTYIRDYQIYLDINQGLRLDVIPLDGYPDNIIKRKVQMAWAFIHHLFNREATASTHFKFMGKVGEIILKIVKNPKTRFKIWKFAEKQMTRYNITDETKYLTDLQSAFKFMKLKYPKEYFNNVQYAEFEGYSMPIPIGYDGYLRMAFGNYMKLPPEEERVPKHDASYINLNVGYEEFKGIHYCIPKK